MKFEQEYRKANPETVGETDREFDLSNYVEWLESLVEEKFTSTNSKSMPFNTASCFDSSCLHYKTHRGCELEQCSRC